MRGKTPEVNQSRPFGGAQTRKDGFFGVRLFFLQNFFSKVSEIPKDFTSYSEQNRDESANDF